MKTIQVLVVGLFATTFAHGQGQFVFNNRVAPEIDARFILPGADPADGSVSSVGSDFSVRLFGGPVGSPIDQLKPLEPDSTGFRSGRNGERRLRCSGHCDGARCSTW